MENSTKYHLMPYMKYKVLICDLDGTLIETLSGETFPQGVWDMKLRFDTLRAIKEFSPEYLFIISNQGGIEKGFINELNFYCKETYIRACISELCGVSVGKIGINYCRTCNPSDPNRKPNTGMLEWFRNNFIDGFDFNKKDTLMIGDASGLEGQFSDTDKKTAENFGIAYMDVDEFIKKYEK